MKWNAEKAIMRSPHNGEHIGIRPYEAVRRIMALSAAASTSGVTKNVAAHLAPLATTLVMLPEPAGG